MKLLQNNQLFNTSTGKKLFGNLFVLPDNLSDDFIAYFFSLAKHLQVSYICINN